MCWETKNIVWLTSLSYSHYYGGLELNLLCLQDMPVMEIFEIL